jgi:hypothetical protein
MPSKTDTAKVYGTHFKYFQKKNKRPELLNPPDNFSKSVKKRNNY